MLDEHEMGALFHAAQLRQVEMVKVLLAAQPDLNKQAKGNGNTALMWGISQGNANSLEVARLLMEAGADVNLANDRGVTALSLAVQLEGAEMVDALLARGANVDSRRCYGHVRPAIPLATYSRATGGTALSVASSLGNTAAVRSLIAADADVNLAQCDGKTPLELALENGHEEVADILRTATTSAPAAH